MPRFRPNRPPPPASALTFTLQDASQVSGLSVSTLRRRAADGSLRLVRVGCRTLVDGASLRALLGIAA
jgi:hypothetical protein